ncbi:transcriptional regulator [Clostridium pasteurianum DSM 525 = ATCC 6013]|uniref:Transcriptional regulator n=1 Tax=Clostridium pasteurianum DSM 525 = ATCC 6013 TaxID=1262449 RepID=A0A0H3J5M5_CLOPA|nr:PucR family transcriptional regulator ligand-binding domain-containing protein [Clostridium pasteurianum]AJA47203.1 transcriptional regulator [Clostridium pasteurianum DSM 525 = ATCC 6013]AJA51191.1 transcriptional regulator [Clostridium pasteurianum DSM 525 = ATCC 6013]AOZ74557.1 transcriptional regulator [Clostridium pasteurianum DSM 525 = ATCC 6013]AOZ78354.1 transcriptional regulator [Clostridium pasteurianum]ELP59412.1 transcriptional regulator [Clostridium pasteurianum DSM 525 = ATCC 
MLITCSTILKLKHLEEMKLVAGKGGINRVIRWIHVVESPQGSEWLKGGELVFITGVVIKDDVNTLAKFVKDLIDKNLSGLVINTGPYITETPEEVKELADKFDFPIFELPFEVKLIDVTQSISRAIFMNKIERDSMNSFMKEIIFGESIFTDKVLNRASVYGYDSSKNYCAIIVDIDNFEKLTDSTGVKSEENIMEIKQNVEVIILSIMNKKGKKVLNVMHRDSIIIMFPMDEKDIYEDRYLDSANEIVKTVSEKMKELTVSVGIGSSTNKLRDFHISVDQAQKALNMIRIFGEKNTVRTYKKLGIYRIFFETNNKREMKQIYYEMLGKLIEYDNKNESNMLKTLETYISEGANLGKAAEKLFIHRNTMKYRMNRIEEILECDLKDINILFEFMEAIKIGKFLNYIS